MKKTAIIAFILWLLSIPLPMLLLRPETEAEPHADSGREDAGDASGARAFEEERTAPSADASIILDVMVDGEKIAVSMDDYLAGVLAAEMPASFPEDALKAQAVAARSFTFHRLAHPPSDGVHDGVPLCGDPAHCKAYRDLGDRETAAALFGSGVDASVDKIRAAVRETDGILLTYEEEPAMAAFHAISGGRTESAEDVWGEAVPYLVEVESPGEEDAVRYRETVEFGEDELRRELEAAFPEAVLPADADAWLTDVRRSEAGMILSAKLGGAPVTGMELRRALSLNSADLSVEASDGVVRITTTGYGHGVGMSQYGARAMALKGADYREILLHYYPGCVLSSYQEEMTLVKNAQ